MTPVIVGVLALVVGCALWWTKVKRLDLTNPFKAAMSLLDLAVLLASTALLGWLGLAIFILVNILGFVAYGVYLAAQREQVLTYAATQANTSRDVMEQLLAELRRESAAVRHLGPIGRAELISLLSQRARTPDEIEMMAEPIAMLWVVHQPDMATFVEQFDRILRLYGEPAGNAPRIADTLTRAVQQSAATFQDMVDAMIAVRVP